MAKVLMERIGSPVESFMDPEVFKTNMEYMDKLNRDYQDKRDEVQAGWGEKYVERVH